MSVLINYVIHEKETSGKYCARGKKEGLGQIDRRQHISVVTRVHDIK